MKVLRIRFQATRMSAILVYAVVIVAALSLADFRLRNPVEAASVDAPAEVTETSTKPFFSLSTNRTFGTGENARLWLDYHDVNTLDFRVYRVNDPAKFFAQLSDPHQMGEQEEEEITTTLKRSPSVVERIRLVKSWVYSGIKTYFRAQLKQDTRRSFNQKFRAPDAPRRTPLNVADYARVPLLNPNQLVTSWREPLPTLEDSYDRRMVPLGKREPGVYLVEAVGQELRAYTIVVVTNLAMVEKSSPNGELTVFAVDRRTGEPRADTQVEIVKAQKTVAAGRTNADGVFRTKIAKKSEDEEPGDPEIPQVDNNNFVILASHRENFAISDLESFYFADNGINEQNVQGYIYTDRPVYRPMHQVFFKGILRTVDDQGRYHPLKSQTVSVTIKDKNDARIYEQELTLSSRGTFHGELTLSEEAPLGTYQIEAETEEGSSSGSFEVAEYKKPEYKVTVTTPQKFVPAGTQSKFEINARYFFGAPVTKGDVKYYIYRSRYYPSYWETDELESDSEDDEVDYSEYENYYSDMVSDGEAKLDASGRLEIPFDVPANNEDDVWDFQYRLEAQVTDASRRTINGSANLVATRGSVIVRATPDRYVYTPGQTAFVKVATTDYEGRPVSAKLTLQFLSRTHVKVERKENEYDPDYELRENELKSVEVTTDREGYAGYSFPISTLGSISIKTVVHDKDKQYTSLGGAIWVASDTEQWPDSCAAYYAQQSSIKLVPDKKSYRVGETAHVLALLPKEGANLLVTTELETVMSARHVNVPGRTVVLDVPIETDYAPNVFLSVTFVQSGDMFTGDQRLVVPARDKLLNLEILSNKQEYKPRETASYTILARDADGAPVRDAEVSVGVVDEAVYSISPDFGNIREQFYGMRYNAVDTRLSVAYWFRGFAGEKPLNIASTKPSYQLADFKNEGEQVEPEIRKDFKDTAYWQPTAITGSDGRATVKFRLPDNLTTWRATARAITSDTRVGVAKSKVIARKDVILRLETPRFLTQGDTVTLSGIVHNYLKQTKSTQISISVNGAQLISPAQQTLNIDPQGEHRVDWQVSAPQTGQITLLAKALTNTESDAVQLTLDIVPRGLHESKAERWVTTDDSAEQQLSLEIPANADLNSRRLRVEVAPSIAGTLFGALDYLTTYPYGCTEQTMSSFLPNVIVSQTLKDFKTTSIRTGNDLQAKVERGRNRLYGFQHDDGGWGWWKDDQSDPFMTAYVIDGLTLAKQAGYEIDDQRIAHARERLLIMLDSADREIDADARSFMVYALAESGGVDKSYIDKLFAERQKLQPYGRALLALTLSLQKDQRAQELATEIERTARLDRTSAFWQTRRPERLDFSVEDQTEGTAMSLKALARIKPNSSLLPLAARWLVSERRNGYFWNSTKDTAFAIFGLIDYVKVSHELTPSYDLEVYVNGETVIAEHVSEASAGRSFVINRKGSAVGATNHVRIVKRGKGSLYFSSAIDYYTNDENVAARGSSDLNVTRDYYRLQLQEDGYKLKWTMLPLTGEIHSGDLLVVKLRLTGKQARHLMLEDPIPSGAEQVEAVGNMNLNYTNSGWSDWYSSREFRDRRTVFFIDRFDGDVTFQYAIRVQVPGECVIAPARAELMYEPAINANTATGRFSFQN